MDIPKFKNIIDKAGFLRNYSSLILPVGILLAGLILFIPTSLMSSGLRKRMTSESATIGRDVRSLSSSVVSRDQWKVEQDYQRAYKEDANEIATLVQQSSQRELLSYKIFPEPKDTSTLIFEEFGQRFRSNIDDLMAHVNAIDCPTAAELQRGMKNVSNLSDARRITGLTLSRLSEQDAIIVDVLCREKAETAFVYANPMDVSGYGLWEEYNYAGMDTAVEDCWYWQLAYWIIEDVFKTIEASNSGSNNVFTSPVKRLMRIGFSAPDQPIGKNPPKPRYVLTAKETLTIPYTGRFCDDNIDVVHFNVVVLVSAKAVMPFMKQLCSAKEHEFKGFSGTEELRRFKHNQITILKSEIKPINRQAQNHEYYRYGEDAVVELNLICEYIFNKNGYDEIKPKSVRKTLGEEVGE